MSIAGRNRRTAMMACLIILGMAGLTAASVPLYDLFCAVTGYGGTPRINARGGTWRRRDEDHRPVQRATSAPGCPGGFVRCSGA